MHLHTRVKVMSIYAASERFGPYRWNQFDAVLIIINRVRQTASLCGQYPCSTLKKTIRNFVFRTFCSREMNCSGKTGHLGCSGRSGDTNSEQLPFGLRWTQIIEYNTEYKI